MKSDLQGNAAGKGRIVSIPPTRLPIGLFPTPLHPLENLSRHLGGPRILAKREDLSGLGPGGNKTRKLAYLMAEARERGATVVLTLGGPQSNHCTQTACAAATLGLRSELFFNAPDPGTRTGNLRVNEMVGARLHFAGAREVDGLRDLVRERAEELRRAGEVPYTIDLGGSEPLGAAGYAPAIEEVVRQTESGRRPTHMVVAAGSVGTLAGIVLGTWVLGLDCSVHGFSVLWPVPKARGVLEGLLEETRRRYFPDVEPQDNYALTDDQLGDGYGVPTPAGREAAELAARLEGLVLDHTYTAKAMAGLIEGSRRGRYEPDDTVLFWHTGGLGGFFA